MYTLQRMSIVILGSIIAVASTFATGLDTVQVEGGLVSGTQNQTGDITVFKGIPFAAPPVGALRWKAPQPVKPWSGVRTANAFGPSPMQNEPTPFSMWSAEFLIPKEPISEDCLYLNVWTGAGSTTEKRPVLVWIYGGGFVSGGSGVPIYDGEALAQQGVVFVSINYRVGLFGFFAHPALTRESEHQASGNYGLMDQLAALKWVQKNITAFGGDPDNVTIAGQSAGAMSVNCLVASPLANGLFQKAIAHSGASFSRRSPSLKQAEQEGERIGHALNASSLNALRQLPAATLLSATSELRGPIIDSYVLPDYIVDIFKRKQQNKVALLTGWNQDEGLALGPIKKAAAFKEQVQTQYGAQANQFLRYYPATNDSVAADAQRALGRDVIFGVQNYTWAKVQSQQKYAPVYVYRFTRKVPAIGEYRKYGAFHTGEVPYAYDNLKFVDRPWEPVDRQLAKTTSSYWINFLKSGDPNGERLPAWPAYSTQRQEVMMFGKEAQVRPLPDAASLDFLYATMLNE